MAEEFLKPGLRQHYYYQPNHMLCWLASGFVLFRSKFGKGGRGNDIASFVHSDSDPYYESCLDFAGEVMLKMSEAQLSQEQAEQAVRAANARYRDVTAGLKFADASNYFVNFVKAKPTALGAGSGALDPKNADALCALIRDHAPIAVFHKTEPTVGHVQLIIGYWRYQSNSADPQIIMFDPEAACNYLDDHNGSDQDMSKTIGEHRLLWEHFQSQIVDQLVTPKFFAY